ncbi:MAG: hypothetical protein MI747_14370 [Desulfobacterales bacterium]|nr:hypothetical protein [Desulfobacterales bacterium]
MKKILLVLGLGLLISGCVGASKDVAMYGTSAKDKKAALEFTKVGVTSSYKLEGLASGSYKSYGIEAGLGYYSGAKTIKISVNKARKWDIAAKARSQSFKAKGLSVSLDNPYVGDVKQGSKKIGTIGISMPKFDGKRNVLKMAGLDTVVNRNLKLKGEAKILGKRYKIASVYKNAAGENLSHPDGYKVVKGSTTLGRVKVGKNMFGGQEFVVWVKSGLKPLEEQSVVSILLVCGWAI